MLCEFPNCKLQGKFKVLGESVEKAIVCDLDFSRLFEIQSETVRVAFPIELERGWVFETNLPNIVYIYGEIIEIICWMKYEQRIVLDISHFDQFEPLDISLERDGINVSIPSPWATTQITVNVMQGVSILKIRGLRLKQRQVMLKNKFTERYLSFQGSIVQSNKPQIWHLNYTVNGIILSQSFNGKVLYLGTLDILAIASEYPVEFTLESIDDGYLIRRNDTCLDAIGYDLGNNSSVIYWPLNYQESQQWQIIQA